MVEPVPSTYTANRKTNAVDKSDHTACKREFRLAIVTLQDRAIADCGNATINIYSFNYENELPSAALLDRFLLDSSSLVLHGLRSPGKK